MRRLALIVLLLAPAALARPMAGDPAGSMKLGDYLPPKPGNNGPTVGQMVAGFATAMGGIASDLGNHQTDSAVQSKEKNVTASLNTLIAQLDQECHGSGGGMNPTKGLKKSILAGGPGGEGDLHDPRAGEKQWGQLKAKNREQILQSKTDGFPAGYESLLQSYYRRLSAEDNTTPAAGANGATADQGAAK